MARPADDAERMPPIRTVAVMICSRGRPLELNDCMASCSRLHTPEGVRIVVCVADNNAEADESRIRAAGSRLGLDLAYAYQPERGYASVRNTALRMAQDEGAELAIFIDDDSTADAGLVSAHVAAAQRYRADAVLGRIEGLSQRAREGRRLKKAGTGNVSIRRWVYDSQSGAGLRFDERLNLLGFEDFEFFADLVRLGGAIYQSTEAISISRPGPDADPRSRDRPFEARRVFAIMEGRNEIAVTRVRHGTPAACLKLVRRAAPQGLRGLLGLGASAVIGMRDPARGRTRREDSLIRLAKARAAIGGLWQVGYERPLAREGRLVPVPGADTSDPRARPDRPCPSGPDGVSRLPSPPDPAASAKSPRPRRYRGGA